MYIINNIYEFINPPDSFNVPYNDYGFLWGSSWKYMGKNSSNLDYFINTSNSNVSLEKYSNDLYTWRYITNVNQTARTWGSKSEIGSPISTGYAYVYGYFLGEADSPPINNPCDDLHNYGQVLWERGFSSKNEAINYLSLQTTSKIAALDEFSFEVLLDAKNAIERSGQWKKVCSGKNISDYLCDIKTVEYSLIPSFDVIVAQYTFNSLAGAYYIGQGGLLCGISLLSVVDPPNIGIIKVTDPKPEQIMPKFAYGSGLVFVPIPLDDVIPEIKDIKIEPLWSTGSGSSYIFPAFYSASLINSSSFDYVMSVYNKESGSLGSEEQFRIIYADYQGSGSRDLGGLDNQTLTKAMYTQYANILLPAGTPKFTINGTEENYVYIIDVKRDRYKDSMDAGNWQLSLYNINDSAGTISTNTDLSTVGVGSLKMTFVDEAVLSSSINMTTKTYNICGGNLESGIGVKSNGAPVTGSFSASIGIFYPNHGVMVFAGSQLDSLYGFNTNRNTERNGLNAARMFRAISAPTINGDIDASGDLVGFIGRNLKVERSRIYFIRVKNQLLNFSNNPTFVSGSDGTIIDSMQYKETAYFTTIGLYNEKKELLAVGKLSKPMVSCATDESLFDIKITY